MMEHQWVNECIYLTERPYVGDSSTYRAWHCRKCLRHSGSKGWSSHEVKKFGLAHYEAKHGGGS